MVALVKFSKGARRAMRHAARISKAEQAAYQEAAARTREMEERRFHDLHDIGTEHDRRCLDIIETELPAIRADLRKVMR